MGVDPGLALVGYAIIEKTGNAMQALTYGCIRTKAEISVAQRLLHIHSQTEELLAHWRPDVMAVEQIFFNRNVTNAFLVGQARGVCMLAAARHNCPVAEYTPLQVKQAVVGNGRAAKQQVAAMVCALLSLPAAPRPDDVADALAVALCHANRPAIDTLAGE